MLGLKRIDWYIMKKFLMTFFLSLILIIGIVIIFDISEKIDDFVSKEAPLKAIIVDYYVNWVPYFMNMFSPRSWPRIPRSSPSSPAASATTG